MIKKYDVHLQSEVSRSFHAVLAAQSLDIDVNEKSRHDFSVNADLETPFNVGLIVGASGSGKSSLARQIYGEFKTYVDLSRAVIDQFPEEMKYEERASALHGIGLTSVPCWIKPVGVLSNGQQARAEAALAMVNSGQQVVIDEWTSVVDRTVAKAMSHCVQKYARRNNKQIILISCHYDILEWLNPDWVIDCNSQRYIDRRSLRPERSERLNFEIREVTRSSWSNLSQYHYLTKELPRGQYQCYGLFVGDNQIGFCMFNNYMPIRKGQTPIFHSARTVIHPDYSGLGLGHRLVNECCRLFKAKKGGNVDIRAAFSSIPLYKSRMNDKDNWKLLRVETHIGKRKDSGEKMERKNGFRTNVKIFSFKYIGS